MRIVYLNQYNQDFFGWKDAVGSTAQDHDFLLVDTAGLRKKGKVSEDIEFYSVMRAVRTIEDSDICLLLLDATRGMEAQDMNILSLIQVQVEYAFENDNLDNLYHPAPKEVWKACRE